MPKKIAIFGFKGGIGKSCISSNLAAGLAKASQKVLLVNLDGQNNSLRNLNRTFKEKNTAYDLIKEENRLSFDACIEHLCDGVDGIASENLQEINEFLVINKKNIVKMYDFMFPPKEMEKYDYVIFDLGPGESFVNAMILKNVKNIILPIEAEYEGIDSIKNAKKYLLKLDVSEETIKVVVPSKVQRKNASKLVVQTISALFPPEKVTLPIPERAAISNAAAFGQSIFDFTTDEAVVQPFMDILTKVVQCTE